MFNFYKRLSLEDDTWQVAVRKIQEKKVYEGNIEGFKLVPNSFRYWCADPFVFTYNNKDYLFVERYDRFKKKGVISVSELSDNKEVHFVNCIVEPYHLSYPCVFELNGNIYMIPETYQAEEIICYKAVNFPYKWEKDHTITKVVAADTTPLFKDDKIAFYLSTIFDSEERLNNNLFLISQDGNIIKNIYNENYLTRSAGAIINTGNMLLRPSQNCKDIYGASILFNKVTTNYKDEYKEELYREIFPPTKDNKENHIKLVDNTDIEFSGIHTYNKSKNYEVIDVFYRGHNFYVFLENLFKKHTN